VRAVTTRREGVPEAFAGVVTPAEHRKAADYTVARQKLGRWELAYDAAVLMIMTLGGGVAAAGRLTESLALGQVWQGTAQVLLVLGVLGALSLPFSIFRTFVLEQRFGFNRTTWAVFLADLAKGLVLGGVLGGAIVAAVLAVMSVAGSRWWLIAWAVWMTFSLVLLWAWPRWIAGLFNKFSPLQDAALRERIDALLKRCDFHARAIYVMDGSRRSAHGNAYFTGLGREKRIVFFDTLLQSLSPVQVEAVLAHELAHFKLKHIPQRLILSGLTTLAGFALLGWLSRQPWFYGALGVDTPSNASALLLFMLVLPAFTWVLAPLAAAWSRRHEFEADAFAARYSDGPELARALVNMYRENASTLTPDPVYSAFYDSHPPPVARIARLVTPTNGVGGMSMPPVAS
ncbi:MAG: M48 family metallopeptidase, partial [Steroidobacteraceae bacterium]